MCFQVIFGKKFHQEIELSTTHKISRLEQTHRCKQKHREAQKQWKKVLKANCKNSTMQRQKYYFLQRQKYYFQAINRITVYTFVLHGRGLATTFYAYWNRKFSTLAGKAARPPAPCHVPSPQQRTRHAFQAISLRQDRARWSEFSTWYHFSQIFFQIAQRIEVCQQIAVRQAFSFGKAKRQHRKTKNRVLTKNLKQKYQIEIGNHLVQRFCFPYYLILKIKIKAACMKMTKTRQN